MNKNDDFDDWWVENKQRLFELYNDAMDIKTALEAVAYEGFKGERKEFHAKTKQEAVTQRKGTEIFVCSGMA